MSLSQFTSQNPSMEYNTVGTISLVSSSDYIRPHTKVFHGLLLTIECKPTSLPCITALPLPGSGPTFQSQHRLPPSWLLQHTTHTSKHDLLFCAFDFLPVVPCLPSRSSLDSSLPFYVPQETNFCGYINRPLSSSFWLDLAKGSTGWKGKEVKWIHFPIS